MSGKRLEVNVFNLYKLWVEAKAQLSISAS